MTLKSSAAAAFMLGAALFCLATPAASSNWLQRSWPDHGTWHAELRAISTASEPYYCIVEGTGKIPFHMVHLDGMSISVFRKSSVNSNASAIKVDFNRMPAFDFPAETNIGWCIGHGDGPDCEITHAGSGREAQDHLFRLIRSNRTVSFTRYRNGERVREASLELTTKGFEGAVRDWTACEKQSASMNHSLQRNLDAQ